MRFGEKILWRIFFILRGVFYLKSTIRKKRFFKNAVFVVYSSGHNGSTTVYYNLLKEFPLTKTFHVHMLSEYWKLKGKVKNNDRNDLLRKKVLNYKLKNPNKKYFFITLIRDPISRGVSSYFYNNKHISEAITIPELINDITKNIDIEKNAYWFEFDYNNFFKVDYNNLFFNTNLGYSIYHFSNNTLSLIIRTDKLNKSFSNAFFELTGYRFGQLSSFNKRKKTNNGTVYNKVTKVFKMDKTILDEYLNTDFVKKFFSLKEINKLKDKYVKKY